MDETKNNNQHSGGDSPPDIQKKLEECEKQKEEYLSGWQRAKADFTNYKRDERSRAEELIKYAVENFIRELIGILDNFDLAIASMEKRPAPTEVGAPTGVGVDRGIYMIRSQIEDMLKRKGVEKIPLKAGDMFNPSVAEAIAEVESDKPPGTIMEEIEPGYMLYDKIVRPARVKISKQK